MNWHFYIDSPQQRALGLCRGSFDEGDGCAALPCGGAGYGSGYGCTNGSGYGVDTGDGFGDGYGWGNGSGASADEW